MWFEMRNGAGVGSRRGLTVVLVAVILLGLTASIWAEPNGVNRFETVEIERVNPDDLPGHTIQSKTSPSGLTAATLPRISSTADIRKLREIVAPNVVKILAVHQAPAPFRQSPMYYEGHGVWLDQGAGEPVLVSTLEWLSEARNVYIMHASVGESTRPKTTNEGLQSAPIKGLESVLIGDITESWVDRNRRHLTPVELNKPDRHRNLVTLIPQDDRYGQRPPGFKLYALDAMAPQQVYGYSPFATSQLVETKMLFEPATPDELQFYFQTSYLSILAAPLVATNGQLIGLTAIKNPHNPQLTLVVPLFAISQYLQVQ